MHSLKIINASHINNMQKCMNTKIKILNCNANLRVYANNMFISYSEVCTNMKELMGGKRYKLFCKTFCK
jgi:hypothetical protein